MWFVYNINSETIDTKLHDYALLTFLKAHHKNGYPFFYHIVTGDKTVKEIKWTGDKICKRQTAFRTQKSYYKTYKVFVNISNNKIFGSCFLLYYI